jgi:hypothetical protein
MEYWNYGMSNAALFCKFLPSSRNFILPTGKLEKWNTGIME